ncbi:MAG: aldo/keto reductase [Firmicutes bacterium]|nr:aldo/keto reductase [Bacillota bacterium]
MNYRKDKNGKDISILGFGCMRFTQKGGRIDLDKAQEEILEAFNAGVNYYDTAYVYPGSEAAVGEIFERLGIRDKLYVATKLPHYHIKSVEGAEKILEEELRRLRTDHIDYYLMHMLSDDKTWERLCAMGIDKWLRRKQEEGVIRQVGFSYHGNSDTFCRIVDAWDWDFCQIQYNYLDEHSQAGRTGLLHAAEKGLPVIIMEPLRGGKLVSNLPDKAKKAFTEHEPNRTPAEWAFRWLWDQPQVTCVLSGMNSVEMVRQNCRIASEARVGDLTDADRAMLKTVVEAIRGRTKVGCTGCRYCMPCPRGVDIPGTFAAYNTRYSDGWPTAFKEYFMCTLLRKEPTSASLCIKCGKCEQHCPQGIAIREELANAAKVLEGPVYKVARKFLPLFMKY